MYRVQCVQGIALLGDLGRRDFQFFADSIQINMGTPTPLEWQSYAHRIFVLAHLVYEDAAEGEVHDDQSECGTAMCWCLHTAAAAFAQSPRRPPQFCADPPRSAGSVLCLGLWRHGVR